MKHSFLIVASFLASFSASAQEFYKGKTITLLVNYGAGGNADTDARLLARHWGRNIPGGPTIIVQNAPGAGGLRAMNMLGKKAGADADGMTVGFFTVSPTPPLVDDPGLQVSMTEDLIPIGGASGWTVAYARKDTPPGIEKPEDLAKAKQIYVGGYSRSSSHDARLRLALDVLELPFTAVTGFPGQNDILKAILQNEVNMSASSLPAYLSLVVPNLIKTGQGIALWHYDVIGADGKPEGNPELTRVGIPPFSEIYQRAYGKAPSGDKFEALLQLNNIGAKLQRGVFLPRGAPRAAVTALQESYEKVARDPAYIAEYEKINNEKPDAIDARGVQSVLDALRRVSSATKKVLKEAVGD